MTSIIVFASSLFLTGSLLMLKALELKRGKRGFFLERIAKMDAKSEKLVSAFRFRCLQVVQTARYIIQVQSKEILRDWLRKAEEKIIEEYRARQSVIMGHREIAANGSVSFYLKKITEHKGSGRRGKIEESL